MMTTKQWQATQDNDEKHKVTINNAWQLQIVR